MKFFFPPDPSMPPAKGSALLVSAPGAGFCAGGLAAQATRRVR
jgi:hypothetical protein